jgi:hypothetical protein
MNCMEMPGGRGRSKAERNTKEWKEKRKERKSLAFHACRLLFVTGVRLGLESADRSCVLSQTLIACLLSASGFCLPKGELCLYSVDCNLLHWKINVLEHRLPVPC